MRILAFLLLMFPISSFAQIAGQDVILAVGLSESDSPSDASGRAAIEEIAKLNPEAKIMVAPNLESARSQLDVGDRIVVLVMVGTSIQEAVGNSTISGSPGKKAGFTIANSIPGKSFSPNLLLYFWNCVGRCRVQSTVQFQKDFRESFLDRVQLEQPEQKLVVANHVNEQNDSLGRKVLRLLISGAENLTRLLPNPLAIFRGISVGLMTGAKYLLPPNAILVSLSFWPSPGAYVGIALGLLWTAKVYLPAAVSERIFGNGWPSFVRKFRKGHASQCALLLGS